MISQDSRAPAKAGAQPFPETGSLPSQGCPTGFLDIEQSVLEKRWVLNDADDRLTQAIMQQHGLPEVVARILAVRGVGLEDVQHFMAPSLKFQMPDPGVLKDMDKAAQRVANAIMAGEKIAVFGDYDVDGATSSALLKRFFRAAGSDLRIYIPDRIDEGYGPNAQAFLQLKSEGMSVVITVDCGVTAFEPLAAAADAGLEVIVLDHHTAEPQLPRAYAVVNPNRLDETPRGLGNLAAVGVAFLFCVAVNRELRKAGWYAQGREEPKLARFLDLVALGTICDVVSLTGLNRAFVAQGLKMMAQRLNPGLVALAEVAGVKDDPTVFHAGFVLGPRVNAGGRVGQADTGARLLSTDDPLEAQALAEELQRMNKDRKDIETAVLREAREKAENGGAMENVVIVAARGWHPGVIGIVASRLKEKYEKPVCVIALDDQGIGKASGRSVHGVDLGTAVISARQQGLLLNGGGHKMAAGFTVEEGRLADLCAYLDAHVARQLDGRPILPELRIDGLVSPSAVDKNLAGRIEMLAPYGAGHAEPRFALIGARIVKPDVVGDSHVRCFIQDTAGGASLRGIAFRALETPLGELLLKSGDAPVHLAGHIGINRWNGYETVQFQIVDGAKVWK